MISRINHSRSIYTTEMDKHYKSVMFCFLLFSENWLFNTYQHSRLPCPALYHSLESSVYLAEKDCRLRHSSPKGGHVRGSVLKSWPPYEYADMCTLGNTFLQPQQQHSDCLCWQGTENSLKKSNYSAEIFYTK